MIAFSDGKRERWFQVYNVSSCGSSAFVVQEVFATIDYQAAKIRTKAQIVCYLSEI